MKLEHPKQADIPRLKNLWQEAFGDTADFIDCFFSAAYDQSRCMCVSEAGQILAAAHWLDCHGPEGKLAYIYGVATAKSARGRGLCHGLMEKIHEKLLQLGYAGAVLVPGEASLAELYGAMGYAFFSGKREFEACRGKPTALRQIPADVFFALRKSFLPADAVLQEGENIRFLQAQASFAAGEDFLLAYTAAEGVLWGMELLGNGQRAPGILGTLGFEKGRFRTPGEEKFAMYKPLLSDTPPGWFGLAFD